VKEKSMTGNWLRQNIAGLLIAIIGVGGAFLGAYYGSNTQSELWRKDKIYQYSVDMLNRRIEIIKAIVRSNVQAQRVDLLMSLVKTDNITVLSKLILCAGEGANNPSCARDTKSIVDVNSAHKEIADLQAEYFANLQLSALYFCDTTRAAIVDINKEREKNWWELDRNLREKLVTAMASELMCNLRLDLLK
jgi:hypothetical protein